MEQGFRFSDDLGPLKVIHVYEPKLGLRGILVVDNVAAGPAIGGLRMAPDVSAEECFRLARAMSLKNAAAGLAHGGGKSVLVGDPAMAETEKEQLIRAFAAALAGEAHYIFGPDMGTNERCMAWVHDEIGRATGLPREIGGIPLDEIGATAWGLVQATEVAIDFCDFELAGARVVIQGFGAVGMHAARFLADKGAILVSAADYMGSVTDPGGLDVDALVALKKRQKSVIRHNEGEKGEREAVIDVECEIWIPAARPDVINESNVDRLKTRLVVQGANIPLTDGAEARLHEKGVLNIPDFIANAGGVICAAMEWQGAAELTVFPAIEDKLRRNTREMLEAATADGIQPRQAAQKMARRRLERAMATRRWNVF